MTWLRFGVAALAMSYAVAVAGAFEIVDSNNGFIGPAFSDATAADQSSDAANYAWLNTDSFVYEHIVMKGDNEKQFSGYSYSGFVFEDQLNQLPASIDSSSIVAAPGPAERGR